MKVPLLLTYNEETLAKEVSPLRFHVSWSLYIITFADYRVVHLLVELTKHIYT